MAVGRRHGGIDRASRDRSLRNARCATATAQLEGHAGAISSEFVGRAPTHCALDHRCRKESFENMIRKLQNPKSKIQINSKHQAPTRARRRVLRFEVSNMQFVWILDFGVWSFS